MLNQKFLVSNLSLHVEWNTKGYKSGIISKAGIPYSFEEKNFMR